VKNLNGKRKFYVLLGLFQLVLVLTVFLTVDGVITMVAAQVTSYDYYNSVTAAALAISAAITLSASVLGSAVALRTVGTAAISSLSEREETFFKAFLIVAFCEAVLLWTKIPTPPI